MKKEVADLWVKALRSGDYTQGEGCLRDQTDNFCCLGVLCDISKQGHWSKLWSGAFDFRTGDVAEHTVLPEAVVEWSGVRNCEGPLPERVKERGFSHSTLWNLNDSGWSFAQIADYIEKNYQDL